MWQGILQTGFLCREICDAEFQESFKNQFFRSQVCFGYKIDNRLMPDLVRLRK
jgi:hypothetical protein